MNLRDQVRAKNIELMNQRDELVKSLPKFEKGGIQAQMSVDGTLELYADGVIDEPTTDAFAKWISKTFGPTVGG